MGNVQYMFMYFAQVFTYVHMWTVFVSVAEAEKCV